MADPAPSHITPRTWRQTFALYGERSTLTMYGLGFACGLPFWLIYDTLTAWLREVGLSLDTIAFFSLAKLQKPGGLFQIGGAQVFQQANLAHQVGKIVLAFDGVHAGL